MSEVSEAESLRCQECTRPFSRPPAAPHKKFCSGKCRDDWHNRERREVAEEIKQRRAASQEGAKS